MQSRILLPLAVVVAALVLDPGGVAAARAYGGDGMQLFDGGAGVAGQRLEIPASLKAEHAQLHAELGSLTRAPGPVGEAARALAAVVHPHFVREERVALPPLGALAALARGEPAPAEARALALSDTVRAELPGMLAEHRAISTATRRLAEVAHSVHDARAQAFAEAMLLHAQNEEEVLYPAAILVGELIRLRTPAAPPRS